MAQNKANKRVEDPQQLKDLKQTSKALKYKTFFSYKQSPNQYARRAKVRYKKVQKWEKYSPLKTLFETSNFRGWKPVFRPQEDLPRSLVQWWWCISMCCSVKVQGNPISKHKIQTIQRETEVFLFKMAEPLAKREASCLYRGMQSQSFFKKLCKAFIPPYTCMEGSKQKSSWLKRSGGKPAEIGGCRPSLMAGSGSLMAGRASPMAGRHKDMAGSAPKGPL